jgi:electron transfer flavoprotein alpha subunit
MFKALILIDQDFIKDSVDLIEAATRLAGSQKAAIWGLGINLSEPLKGFDTQLQVELPTEQLKDSRVITDIIEQVQQEYAFDSILILATDFGRMVAPRLAMRLRVGLVADITDIEVEGSERRMIRPAFSGNMLASIVCDSTPIMVSVHPNVFQTAELTKEPIMLHFPLKKMKASSIEVLASVENETSQDIREAQVLVAAGAGFKAPMDELQSLAERLNGSVAVSKPVVEQQRAPREIQVGQSGKTVSPELYLALGIYGSMQHIEGLKNVSDIISVNIDEGAPMNYLANLVVVGDAATFVEKLNTRLEEVLK